MEFNINRLRLLVTKDFKELLFKTLGIISLILFGIITFNIVMSWFHGYPNGRSFEMIPAFLMTAFIGCAIMGSTSFEEINKRPKRIEFLNLPSSALEKTLSKFLTVAIAYPLGMIILYYLLSVYANILTSIGGSELTISHSLDETALNLFTIGSIIIAFFAYGSIKYNTGSFIKIIIWGFALFAAFAAISFIIAFITFPELRAVIFNQNVEDNLVHTDENIENFWVISLVKKLFYITPLIFWVLSYFTLKEKEA